MRIISGDFRGRNIQCPSGSHVRPTSDRVRESVFNLLTSRLSLTDQPVADWFAGSGAYGIECLSRGASGAQFIDNHPLSIRTIKENLKSLNIPPAKTEIIKADVHVWVNKTDHNPFSVIFADPPYGYEDRSTFLSMVTDRSKPWKTSWIVFETRSDFSAPEFDLAEVIRDYGSTRIVLFKPDL